MPRLIPLILLVLAAGSFAAEKKGHPLIKPYTGSTLEQQEGKAFQEIELLVGKSKEGKAVAEKLEGKTTLLEYKNPAGRSELEVSRNYEDALKASGFQMVYVCSGGKDCPEFCVDDFGCSHAMWSRYVVGKLKRATGDVWVAVKAEEKTTHIAIVELKPMETGMVTIDASAMAKGIDADGHVAVYGIVFDTGKADLKPESDPQLKEIAALLKQRADLKIHVVGHTDNVGELSRNMDLSKRRADAVLQALVKRYAVAANRLNAAGVGPLVPIATNDNDAGRARNRRVDLVKQ